jgi:hypothetical protein
MAIIDLGSGSVEKKERGLQPGSRVIDLDSGKLIPTPQYQEKVKAELPPIDRGMRDFVTGSGRIAATPELGTLPEFSTTPEGDTFRLAIGMLSTFDPKAQRDIIQETIPEAIFEATRDGSTIIEVPTQDGGVRRSVLNRPGFSPRDAMTAIAQALAFIPAAKFANLGKTLASKVMMGGAAAGATEQGLQESGIVIGRQERDPLGTGIATLLGGGAEVVMPAIQGYRAAKQAEGMGAAQEEISDVASNIRVGQEASEATGIGLWQGQQTVVPSTLEKQSFLSSLPAGTTIAMNAIKQQNTEASAAVESFLASIAPDSSLVTAGEKLRSASQGVVERIKNIRAEKSAPIYKEAFTVGADVDLGPVKKMIADNLDNLPKTGEVAKALIKVSRLIKNDRVVKPSLEKLHNAKIEIDQMIDKRGSDSLGNTTKAKLRDVKNALLAQMDESSDGYRLARDTYAKNSPRVVKVQDSIIGKIAELDDIQLKQITGKLFDAQQTNPKIILDAKAAIREVDPEAWDQIVRAELERRIGGIRASGEEVTAENIPGQLQRALFPNEKSSKVLYNALDGEQKQNLIYLQTALNRAKLGRPGGSQTATREEIKRELRGGVYQSIRNFLKEPLSTLASSGEDAAFNRNVRVMSKMLYDPTWKAEMKNIRQFNPASPAAGRAFTQLLNDIESSED